MTKRKESIDMTGERRTSVVARLRMNSAGKLDRFHHRPTFVGWAWQKLSSVNGNLRRPIGKRFLKDPNAKIKVVELEQLILE
jgi:hypothetical protein